MPIEERKKKKRTRKDKWGQPLPAVVAGEEEEQEVELDDGGDGVDEPQVSSYEPNKVVVSGMPYSSTEDQIRSLFKDIGPVQQLQLSKFPDSGGFRGLAFVSFQTEEIAISSLKLDGSKMGNRFIKVERCRLDPQRKRKSGFVTEPKKVDGCSSAYIGNLAYNVTEDDIRECFGASNIDSIRFAINKTTGAFRGFCHVDFADDESLEKAMKKNQVELHGRPMKIAYAVSNRH
ncbi:putative RNA recognition motif domain, nucleotide-binding alpha-beta plait domain superfamily [Dioscorea sansibarensis]